MALSTGLDPLIAARLKRDAIGLVPAIVQQYDSGAVLMLAWMNDAALARTLTTGQATYWSRSRQTLWVKGETSGNRQAVHSVALDCDGDTLLVRVDQTGPACHTGTTTCFEDVLLADERDEPDERHERDAYVDARQANTARIEADPTAEPTADPTADPMEGAS